MNSVIISFDKNNCYIIKTHTLLHQIMTAIAMIKLISKVFIKKIPIMTNHILLIYLTFYMHRFLQRYQFFRILIFIFHANCRLKKLWIMITILYKKRILSIYGTLALYSKANYHQIKFNIHVVFSIFSHQTVIYFFILIFNSAPYFCIFFQYFIITVC